MLTKPLHGWTDFQLDGTSCYSLSYLDDIPFQWLDRAIVGLSTLTPFQVTGNLEPEAFACQVSLSHCRVEGRETEYSDTTMLAFCQYLHRDIRLHLEDWAAFTGRDTAARKQQLEQKLSQLQALITKNERYFG